MADRNQYLLELVQSGSVNPRYRLKNIQPAIDPQRVDSLFSSVSSDPDSSVLSHTDSQH